MCLQLVLLSDYASQVWQAWLPATLVMHILIVFALWQATCLIASTSSTFYRMLLLKRAVQRYMEQFPDEVQEPLELRHWQVLNAVKELLATVKAASLKLEADTVPTGGQALWVFHKLLMYLNKHATDSEHLTDSAKNIMKLAGGIMTKLGEELASPNWLFGLAFLALMDVSGECMSVFFAVLMFAIFVCFCFVYITSYILCSA